MFGLLYNESQLFLFEPSYHGVLSDFPGSRESTYLQKNYGSLICANFIPMLFTIRFGVAISLTSGTLIPISLSLSVCITVPALIRVLILTTTGMVWITGITVPVPIRKEGDGLGVFRYRNFHLDSLACGCLDSDHVQSSDLVLDRNHETPVFCYRPINYYQIHFLICLFLFMMFLFFLKMSTHLTGLNFNSVIIRVHRYVGFKFKWVSEIWSCI